MPVAPVVVVEEDASLVAALINEERPLVIGSAQERGVLEDAAVRSAKVVVIATDDLETAAVASRLVREVNATCELVIRCPDDDVGAVLAKTYRARAVSTSRLAASFIQGQAVKARARAVVVLGKNNVGERVVEALAEKRIPYSFADVTEDVAKLAAAGVAEADMVIVCDDDLGKNLVRVDRIRDLNKRDAHHLPRVPRRGRRGARAPAVRLRRPLDLEVRERGAGPRRRLPRGGDHRRPGANGPRDARDRVNTARFAHAHIARRTRPDPDLVHETLR